MAELFFPENKFETNAKTEPILVKALSIADNIGQELLAHSVEIAADAFGVGEITPEFEQDVRDHLKRHHMLFAYSKSGEPIGFASVKYLTEGNIGNLYVSGLVVKKPVQKQGVGTILVKEAANLIRSNDLPVDYISGRTQNPIVAQARMGYCDPVYPLSSTPSEEVVLIGQQLHSHLKMIEPMDPTTLVTKNVFDHQLNDARPLSKYPAINDFFGKHVGPRDAVFIIGRPNF